MTSSSEARVRSWEIRRAKYGPAGRASDPHVKLSDKVSDTAYLERLIAKCKKMPNGCWEFQGFCGAPPRNYGHYSYRGKPMHAHRVAYTTAKGPIPKGMVVMHCCDNPPCCNPNHLRLGTHLENMSECRAKNRYYYAKQTHCKHGHEWTPENTYYIPTPGPMFGLRKCKACQLRMCRERYHRDIEAARARAKRYRERRKAKAAGSCSETVCEQRHE